MQVEIRLPEDLEDGGNVLDVFVHVGDEVRVEQGLIEIETDKATVEVPSTHAGRVVELRVKEGDALGAGDVIVLLETADVVDTPPAATPPPKPAAVSPQPMPPQPTPPTLPQQAAEPTVPDPPPTLAAARPSTPSSPPPTPAAPQAAANIAAIPPSPPIATPGHSALAPAGPAMRRFAREVGVDIHQVHGTGPAGRITREDVLAVVRQTSQLQAPAAPATQVATTRPAAPAAAPEASTEQDSWGPIQVEKMTKIRKTIASKMHESWSTVPRVTNFDDADVTALEAMRQASKADYAASGIKLTTLPFVVKACALSLKSNPLLNASIDMANEHIVFKKYVNVGIAVDTDRGLVVPSLRNADHLSIPAIARALGEMAEDARTGNFAINDLRGSTFTISNLGAIGGTYSTPIINTPEVAILLVGRARKMPVVVDEEIVVRLMMPLSLSYDHRLVDGGAAARFLNDVIRFLNTPSRLLIAP